MDREMMDLSQLSAPMRAFIENDRVLNGLGMAVEEVRPGYARLSMPIDERHLNGYAKGHGGMIFTLADQSFGVACNAHDVPAVAEHCAIAYAAPVEPGDRLTAVCDERLRRRRSAIYDVTVTNQKGEVVAEMRCHARTVTDRPFPAT